ncbi:putative E3 ubiquitin-protein ligase Itchy [Paratrimastix pyriformis]|uniref:HECT-type E3 ubiquitin transferase n=1 Tax=Paratrimastix pyriformis TaxID=342808 RepID=A0ABQ8UTG6_9EUKA|nr:putative E3 ubiquitin-protein ligase Itchy [Paratrimastix pyriformis]
MLVNFSVRYRTCWGQTLCVVGSCPELGNWNPFRAYALTFEEYEFWAGTVSLSSSISRLEYKYCIRTDAGAVLWEDSRNRVLELPPPRILDLSAVLSLADLWNQACTRSLADPVCLLRPEPAEMASWELRIPQSNYCLRSTRFVDSKPCLYPRVPYTINRATILSDSFDSLQSAPNISITFYGEPGIDCGGVRREWFSLLSQQLFSDVLGLFRSSSAGALTTTEVVEMTRQLSSDPLRTRYDFRGGALPSWDAGVFFAGDPLPWFRFVGRFMAIALCGRGLLPSRIALSVLKYILDEPLGVADLVRDAPESLALVSFILRQNLDDPAVAIDDSIHMSVDEEYLVSTRLPSADQQQQIQLPAVPEPWQSSLEAVRSRYCQGIGLARFHRTTVLVPNGDQVQITEANKAEFLCRLVRYRLVDSIRESLEAIKSGFFEVIQPSDLRRSRLDAATIFMMLFGASSVSLAEWRVGIDTYPYDQGSVYISWFWRFLEECTDEQRSKLLWFVTGTSVQPAGGLLTLVPRFTVVVDYRENCLPSASTCSNQLRLPHYSRYELLKRYMLLALTDWTQGFGLEPNRFPPRSAVLGKPLKASPTLDRTHPPGEGLPSIPPLALGALPSPADQLVPNQGAKEAAANANTHPGPAQPFAGAPLLSSPMPQPPLAPHLSHSALTAPPAAEPFPSARSLTKSLTYSLPTQRSLTLSESGTTTATDGPSPSGVASSSAAAAAAGIRAAEGHRASGGPAVSGGNVDVDRAASPTLRAFASAILKTVAAAAAAEGTAAAPASGGCTSPRRVLGSPRSRSLGHSQQASGSQEPSPAEPHLRSYQRAGRPLHTPPYAGPGRSPRTSGVAHTPRANQHRSLSPYRLPAPPQPSPGSPAPASPLSTSSSSDSSPITSRTVALASTLASAGTAISQVRGLVPPHAFSVPRAPSSPLSNAPPSQRPAALSMGDQASTLAENDDGGSEDMAGGEGALEHGVRSPRTERKPAGTGSLVLTAPAIEATPRRPATPPIGSPQDADRRDHESAASPAMASQQSGETPPSGGRDGGDTAALQALLRQEQARGAQLEEKLRTIESLHQATIQQVGPVAAYKSRVETVIKTLHDRLLSEQEQHRIAMRKVEAERDAALQAMDKRASAQADVQKEIELRVCLLVRQIPSGTADALVVTPFGSPMPTADALVISLLLFWGTVQVTEYMQAKDAELGAFQQQLLQGQEEHDRAAQLFQEAEREWTQNLRRTEAQRDALTGHLAQALHHQAQVIALLLNPQPIPGAILLGLQEHVGSLLDDPNHLVGPASGDDPDAPEEPSSVVPQAELVEACRHLLDALQPGLAKIEADPQGVLDPSRSLPSDAASAPSPPASAVVPDPSTPHTPRPPAPLKKPNPPVTALPPLPAFPPLPALPGRTDGPRSGPNQEEAAVESMPRPRQPPPVRTFAPQQALTVSPAPSLAVLPSPLSGPAPVLAAPTLERPERFRKGDSTTRPDEAGAAPSSNGVDKSPIVGSAPVQDNAAGVIPTEEDHCTMVAPHQTQSSLDTTALASAPIATAPPSSVPSITVEGRSESCRDDPKVPVAAEPEIQEEKEANEIEDEEIAALQRATTLQEELLSQEGDTDLAFLSRVRSSMDPGTL